MVVAMSLLQQKYLWMFLSGNGTSPQNDVVTANAGLAFHCLKPETSIEDCIDEAQEALVGGKALNQFKILLN